MSATRTGRSGRIARIGSTGRSAVRRWTNRRSNSSHSSRGRRRGSACRSTWRRRCRWWSARSACSSAAKFGLLKSTMLQLDSAFNEKAYGASSFTDFVEKLQKAEYVEVTGGEGRYMIRMKGGGTSDKPGAKPEEAIPLLRDVLETHRIDI